MSAYISAEQLGQLVADVVSGGMRVIAPVKASGTTAYAPIENLADASLDGDLPTPSLKAHFLPPNEALLSWRRNGGDVEIAPAPTTFAPQLVLGARPCDAAALEVVDKVMNWDYADELWNGRRAATTVISLACSGVDDSCFCSTVGLAPDATRGSDVMLTQVDGGYVAEPVSEKGEAFLGEYSRFFGETPSDKDSAAYASRAEARERVQRNLKIDTKRVANWLDTHFDDDLWPKLGPRCNGCGACASVCPTCHCFDINDEPMGPNAGVRRRNWDTCQSSKFTVHASGHNPRGDQNARHRQRISHKFYIYPSKFGEVLCTGCGRCVRACPASQDLVYVLDSIDRLAAAEEEAS